MPYSPRRVLVGPIFFAWIVGAAIFFKPSTSREGVYQDGIDRFNLLDKKLVNRQLFQQLSDPRSAYRLGRGSDLLVWAANASVASQVAAGGSEQTRFHGAYILDTYAAMRPFAGLDININLQLLNPSASDGYRFSNQILSGVALHVTYPLATVGRAPLILDFVSVDLDTITLGSGLLLEQVPLEGHMGGLRWRDYELHEVFGGRVFWDDDDLLAATFGRIDKLWQLNVFSWLTSGDETGTGGNNGDTAEQAPKPSGRRAAVYVGMAGQDTFVDETLHLAWEYSGRSLQQRWRSGMLLRGDLMLRDRPWGNLHLGYQARYYQKGIGPRDHLRTPSSPPSLPVREDAYVTNSVEMLAMSTHYDQWSHTAMAELRWRWWKNWYMLADAEMWVRWLRDPRHGDKRVVYLYRGGRAPGMWADLYYRLGVMLKPWTALPHRLRAYVGNKQVTSGFFVVAPDNRRFSHDPLLVLEMEVFL